MSQIHTRHPVSANGMDEFVQFGLSAQETLDHLENPWYFEQNIEFLCSSKFKEFVLWFEGTEQYKAEIKEGKLLKPIDWKELEEICDLMKPIEIILKPRISVF